jgi:hypothetical protein
MSTPARTYPVDVEGVGHFVFRKRTLQDQITIQASAARRTGGQVDDPELRSFVHALCVLKTLTVQSPEGWDPEALDPLEPGETGKIWDVHEALRSAEEKFRSGAGAKREAVGAEPQQDA